jgi:ribosome-binding protein aMBF1 (putative translation factor)
LTNILKIDNLRSAQCGGAPVVRDATRLEPQEAQGDLSPIGSTAAEGRRRRAARSAAYRDAQARLAPYARIARQLIHYRTLRNMTQHELARAVGTSVSAVSRIESGQHPTTVQTLERFAKALGLEIDISFREPATVRGREPVFA